MAGPISQKQLGQAGPLIGRLGYGAMVKEVIELCLEEVTDAEIWPEFVGVKKVMV